MKSDDTSSDSDTKHVLLRSPNFSKMNKFNAMQKRIKEIVILEERPFSFIDLKGFEVDGTRYELKHGVIRNYLSKLTRSGAFEFAYNSGVAFYTLPRKNFTKYMTAHHMGGSCSSSSVLLHQLPIKNTPIYKWLKNRRFSQMDAPKFTEVEVALPLDSILRKIGGDGKSGISYILNDMKRYFYRNRIGKTNTEFTFEIEDNGEGECESY